MGPLFRAATRHNTSCSDNKYNIKNHHFALHGVQRKIISVDNFFVFLRFFFFCFDVAICDIVHAVEATYDLP